MPTTTNQSQHGVKSENKRTGFRRVMRLGRDMIKYAVGLLAGAIILVAFHPAHPHADKTVQARNSRKPLLLPVTMEELRAMERSRRLTISAVAQYALWVTENAGSRGLFMDCVLRNAMDSRTMHSLAVQIFTDVNGHQYGQITIRWHLQNGYDTDAPWAESYIIRSRAVHRLLQSPWSS